MKMVSAAKLRKAQDKIIHARPYFQMLETILTDIFAYMPDYQNPLFEKRDVKRIGIAVVTSDRGLCGAFNTNIIKKSVQFIQENPECESELMVVGRKAWEFFSKRNYPILYSHVNIFQHLDFSVVPAMVRQMTETFLAGKVDRWVLIYNQFKSPVQQIVTVENFLPLELPEPGDTSVDYIFEPDKESLLDDILPRYLETKIWKMLLESNASEHGARMTAMENATENAREMIATLTLSYNRARQAAITKEISEIVGGAEALKG